MSKEQKKILVVDDDLGLVRLLEKRLASNGYEVISALSGTVGLKRAREESPDLILLDIKMPDFSGGEVARELKNDPETKGIPIVFITITISKKDDKVNKEIEIDGQSYPAFAKPVYGPKLLSVIRKAMQK